MVRAPVDSSKSQYRSSPQGCQDCDGSLEMMGSSFPLPSAAVSAGLRHSSRARVRRMKAVLWIGDQYVRVEGLATIISKLRSFRVMRTSAVPWSGKEAGRGITRA